MDDDEVIDTDISQDEWPFYNRGWRYWREGFYIWLGKRLPAGLVFFATNQLLEFADEEGIPSYDIVNAQSYWFTEKMK